MKQPLEASGTPQTHDAGDVNGPLTGSASETDFDKYAAEYDAALLKGLRLTGESKSHYAEHRVRWLKLSLARSGIHRLDRVLDFGCGDGDASPMIRDILNAREIIGVDESTAMITLAQARHPWGTFSSISDLTRAEPVDAAYCNGVFHHIAEEDRLNAARSVYEALRPGGLFGFWENNPWNPGTRLVMRRIPFDKDAILLSPPHARRLLRRAGFTILRTDHWFIFPSWLSALRPLERPLSRLPIGGQYQVLAQRPP